MPRFLLFPLYSIPDIICDNRFASKLKRFRVQISTNSGKSSFKFAGPTIWESEPPETKRLSFISFEKERKCGLLINQS